MNWLLTALACGLGCIAVHAILRRVQSQRNAVVTFGLTALVGGAVLLALTGREYGWTSGPVQGALALYFFGCELYTFMFTFVIGSISAWILMNALRPGAASVRSESDAPQHVGMVETRLARLCQVGFLGKRGDRYFLSAPGKIVAGAYHLLRWCFAHDLAAATAGRGQRPA